MRFRLFVLALLMAWVAGCGGGGGGVGEGGTGSFSSGPISGFGSVIVNGIRFDDSSAGVIDDEGRTRLRDELRLGMVVAIESTRIADSGSGPSATARSIRIGSEVVGMVTAVDVANSTFSVFGQTVRVVVDRTVFDERLAGGLAALVPNTTVVEVYGFLDRASGVFVATRVEPRLVTNFAKLRAVLDAVDSTSITIGGQVISTVGVTLPPGLAPGVIVRVIAQRMGAGWVAIRVEAAALRSEDRDDARVEGRITTLTSTRSFVVDGLAVDATSATFPDGEAGIVVGARVEVEGAVVAGTLVATRVKLEDDAQEFELHGTVSTLNSAARTFVLRGVTQSVTVSYTASTRFDPNGSTEADLADGRRVEVRGLPSADGTRMLALRIEFES